MPSLLIFGLGYSAQVIAARWRARGWSVEATGSAGDLDFGDPAAVHAAIAQASHILSSVPPAGGADPVLVHYGAALGKASAWLGYLSSTGVYGDTGGAWVDETAPTGQGRRTARAEADARWLALGAHSFRLPGIYGPGRSVIERLRAGTARRIDLRDQVFSRTHVADIAGAVLAAIDTGAAPGAWNIADNCPASHNAVIAEACARLRLPLPPLQSLDDAGLSPMARGFYAENRRVANGRATRLLGWRPLYPSYVEGLASLTTL